MNDTVRPTTVLRKAGLRKSALSDYARVVLLAMTGNTRFPNPSVALSAFKADIDALDAAIVASATGAPGTVKDRVGKEQKVGQDLSHLRDYVQGVIETVTVPAIAIAWIESAGMFAQRLGKHYKLPLAVLHGVSSGDVTLVAKAVARNAMYFWSFSTDQKTWSTPIETMKATVSFTGLTPGVTYYFRFRTHTRKNGATDFGQIVAFMVK